MALKIHSGELNRTVGIYAPVSTKNNEGGKETTYPDLFGEAVARIKSNRNRALYAGAQVLLNTDEVVIRFTQGRSAIKEDWRITYGGLNHQVQSVEIIERSWIVLTVKAVE